MLAKRLIEQFEIGRSGIYKLTASPLLSDQVREVLPHFSTAVVCLYFNFDKLTPKQGYVLEYDVTLPGSDATLPIQFFLMQDIDNLGKPPKAGLGSVKGSVDHPDAQNMMDTLNSAVEGFNYIASIFGGKTKADISCQCRINGEFGAYETATAILTDPSVVDAALLKELFVDPHIENFVGALNSHTPSTLDPKEADKLDVVFRKAGVFTLKSSLSEQSISPRIKYKSVETLFKA